MSEPADTPAFEEVEPAASPPPIHTVRGMIREPAVRNYLIAGAAALGMIFLILLSMGSDIGGLLLLTLGALGIVFRWPAMPTFFLLILLYFLAFPLGDPSYAFRTTAELRYGHFRVPDVMLVFSVLVYLMCHYRVYGMTANGLPYEQRRWKKHARRPADLVRKGELPRFLWLAGGVVLAGQFLWLLATTLDIDVNADFPLHVAEDVDLYVHRDSSGLRLWMLRLVILFGLGFFATLLGRLVFGYWRLRVMSAAEGALMLQEADWTETHRERVRIEKWREWQQAKLKKQQERGERQAGRKRRRGTPTSNEGRS